MRKLLVLLLFLLCLCNVLFAAEPSSDNAQTDSTKTEEENKEDDVIIIKVKDPVTGKEKEVEVKNGEMPDGKIFIGVGRKKPNLEKERKVKAMPVPGVNAPAGEEDPNVKDKDKVSNQSVPGMQLVENMRALRNKIPYQLSYIGEGGTGCVYSVSMAAVGTPYGSINEDGSGGPFKTTQQILDRAKELNQLIVVSDANFSEAIQQVMPGDICIVGYDNDMPPGEYRGIGVAGYRDNHATMATLNKSGGIGTINNGESSHDGDRWPGGGIWEYPQPPWEYDRNQKLGYIIKSSGYSGGLIGAAFDGLQQLGEALNKIIERFSQVSIIAYKKLNPVVFDLIALLAMIDLALSIIMAGFEINLITLAVKAVKYGFVYFVYGMWPDIVDWFYKSLVVSVNETANPDVFSVAAENVCQPQLILQKVMYLLKPGFDYISSMSAFDLAVATAFGGLVGFMLCALFTLLVSFIYIFFAVYVAYVYVSFFVFAALAVVTLPFMTSKFTKFFTEGGIGAAWTACIRLMVITFLLGMMTYLFTGADFTEAAGLAAKGTNSANTFSLVKANWEITSWYLKQCTALGIFAIFMIKITDSIADKLGGRFELSL